MSSLGRKGRTTACYSTKGENIQGSDRVPGRGGTHRPTQGKSYLLHLRKKEKKEKACPSERKRGKADRDWLRPITSASTKWKGKRFDTSLTQGKKIDQFLQRGKSPRGCESKAKGKNGPNKRTETRIKTVKRRRKRAG